MGIYAWIGVLTVSAFIAFLALRKIPYRGPVRDATAFWIILVVFVVWGALSAHWLMGTKVT